MNTEFPEKIFILDTNVILHDSACIMNFDEHWVVVPITVLEELDTFKKGNLEINYHAREFVRTIDALCPDKMFNGGYSLGENKGKLSLRLEKQIHDDLKKVFVEYNRKDHKILNVAYHINIKEREAGRKTKVILVSKDVNLRMKARAIGLLAEDYTNDHIPDPSQLYSGYRIQDHVSYELIKKIYASDSGISLKDFQEALSPRSNEFLVLKNGKTSALGIYKKEYASIRRVEKETVYGVIPRNAEQIFAVHALKDTSIPLVSIGGKAGTGKTLLALASALELRSSYRQIMLCRPVIPLSNKDIGYLPGDIQSKLNPYMQPLFDNLGVIREQFPEKSEMHKRLNRLLDENKLCIEPLAYIRGRNLVKKYLIVDEAQNLTPHEVKTIITRAGEGTKIVFTGDIKQIDHPYLNDRSNGLSYLINRMSGQEMYAHIDLKKGERSALSELASSIL